MPTRPAPGMPVEVSIAGTAYTLRYPLRVLKALDHEHGINVMKGGEAIAGTFQDPERLAILLHAGIHSTRPEITLDWIEDNIDASMLLDLMPLLVYAASGRWIDLEPAPSPNGHGAALPTGSRSGPSDDMTSESRKPNSGI